MHHSFIPPYLLQRLASRRDDDHVSACCERTLQVDDQLRNGRVSRPDRSLSIMAAAGTTRTVHTANNTEELPGTPARSDGDEPTGDEAVDEAFDSSGEVWDLFAEVFQRQSVDGNGTPISITVHYGTNYDNAFWDGQQLVFGDGDGTIFERFTKPMDVMAHEFAHGVTQFTAGLTYQDQSGALNESVSDVFAAMTKQRVLGQTADQADWLIGEGLFKPGVQATALRSMKEPGTAYDDPRLGKDPQVGSMADYVDTTDDNGGVHINSGIPNRAFYLVATAIGGNSWERPGQVWYHALTSGEVTSDTEFIGFAQATVSSANALFPGDPAVAEQVEAAWTEVGLAIDSDPAPDDPDQPPPASRVWVRRSGGFAGLTRTAEVDLDSDPRGPSLRSLLDQSDFQASVAPRQAPDRFLYTVEYGEYRLQVSEQDLSPELNQVIHTIMDET